LCSNNDRPTTQDNVPHRDLNVRRLYSYIYQFQYAMAGKPHTILYVGKGTGIAASLLSRCPGHPRVITLDNDEQLEPDIVASVLQIPLEDGAVDVTLCCEVLEHLPFDKFAPALCELRRVTRSRLVLSLPDVRLFFGGRINIPLLKIRWQLSLPRFGISLDPKKKFEQSGHYWEIGYKGSGIRAVKQKIRAAGWRINEVRRVDDWSWHTFFDLS